MQPSPMAETSRLLFPSLRFCIVFFSKGASVKSVHLRGCLLDQVRALRTSGMCTHLRRLAAPNDQSDDKDQGECEHGGAGDERGCDAVCEQLSDIERAATSSGEDGDEH